MYIYIFILPRNTNGKSLGMVLLLCCRSPKPHLTSGFIVIQALPASTAAIAQHVRSVRCVARRVEIAMAPESWVQWSWSTSLGDIIVSIYHG